MDIVALLQGLKGKVLDLRDIELLKHTYELQDENLKQLKTNNEAIRENAVMLHDKIGQLQRENTRLVESNEQLLSEIKQYKGARGVTPRTEMDPNDCIALIQSWMGSRDFLKNLRVITYAEVDRELNLPPGFAKKYIEAAARKWNYFPERKGQETITFQQSSQGLPFVSIP